MLTEKFSYVLAENQDIFEQYRKIQNGSYALITRRSWVQIPPPQPYRVDVTDFSYIHFFLQIMR